MANLSSIDDRFEICKSIGEECVQEDELRNLLLTKANPVAYDGFEPSGKMHLAQGILKALNVNKLTSCGFLFKFLIADYFAQLNEKLNGDLYRIRTVGQYFIEVWKAVGMKDIDTRVQFLVSSEEIHKAEHEYWPLVMDISRRTSLHRMIKSCQIMGRRETDEMPASSVLYVAMQCGDIFFLGADVCQLGLDQRKVNVLAREYCDKVNRTKPIILSHPMIPGLLQGQYKMSKSDPSSSIFMDDSEAVVIAKIKKAFCPPAQIKENPCIAYVELLVLPWLGEFQVNRLSKHGGNVTYDAIAQVHSDYETGHLHPGDLKAALAAAINKMLQPVREHFENDPRARLLLDQVQSFVNK